MLAMSRKVLFAAILGLLTGFASTANADVGPIRSPITGVWYLLKTDRGTQDQAQNKAVTLQHNGSVGCLAVVHSDQEFRWLVNTFGPRLEWCWMGYNRNRGSVPGPWRAMDGSTVNYSCWSSGEPNNTANKEDAIIIWKNGPAAFGLGWADITRDNNQSQAPPNTGGYLVMFAR